MYVKMNKTKRIYEKSVLPGFEKKHTSIICDNKSNNISIALPWTMTYKTLTEKN